MNSLKSINLRHPVYVELDMKTTLMEKNDILRWSLSCMDDVTTLYMKEYAHDPDVLGAFDGVKSYLDGKISVNDGRAVALKMHERARHETTPSVIFYFRALGQMVSIIHVKTHAMGHLYYTLKMLNQLNLDLIDHHLKDALKRLDLMEKGEIR